MRNKTATCELGKRLRLTRGAHGLSMRDLEKITGIANATICRVENGKPVDYETGKQLEKWITEAGEALPCDTCYGKGWVST